MNFHTFLEGMEARRLHFLHFLVEKSLIHYSEWEFTFLKLQAIPSREFRRLHFSTFIVDESTNSLVNLEARVNSTLFGVFGGGASTFEAFCHIHYSLEWIDNLQFHNILDFLEAPPFPQFSRNFTIVNPLMENPFPWVFWSFWSFGGLHSSTPPPQIHCFTHSLIHYSE